MSTTTTSTTPTDQELWLACVGLDTPDEAEVKAQEDGIELCDYLLACARVGYEEGLSVPVETAYHALARVAGLI